MTTPTDQQIAALLRPFHNLNHTTQKNGPTNLERIEQKILNACRRNRTIDTEDVRQRDGYPSGGGPGNGGQDTPDSPTQAAAFANLGTLYDGQHHQHPDPVHDHVTGIHLALVGMAESYARLLTHLAQLDKISDPRRTTNPVAHCQACDRIVECTTADPIRAGYCNACDTAWRRWKTDQQSAGLEPDRVRFERWRREQLAA